jgi:hypothetical protein
MATIDFHQKISGHEAKEWLRKVCDAMDRGATFDDEEGFIKFISEQKPKDFKAPRKSRASKKSSEERAESEYDCQLCDARVWNNALGGQCSRKKIEGECICSIHKKESGKNDGCLRNGLVTDDRPTHAYGDETQQMLPWHDVEIPKKTKKTSGGGGKGTRKCSNCGECGHNKKTCPLLKSDTEETVEKKEVVEETVDDGWANDTEELSDEEEETVVEEEEKKVVKKEKKVEKKEKENVEDVISTVRAALIDVVKTVEDTVTVEDESVEDDDGSGVGFEQTDSPTTEPLSETANSSDLEEDESGDTIVFEGVEYTFDEEEAECRCLHGRVVVYDDELAEVGTWDGKKIEFLNATAAKFHRVRKLTSKND